MRHQIACSLCDLLPGISFFAKNESYQIVYDQSSFSLQFGKHMSEIPLRYRRRFRA